MPILGKIISGGQTGADQGALDAAIGRGFPYGGAVPAGRRTEDGVLPCSYQMEELASGRYADRTRKNVEDGDGTLIVSHGPLSGGSELTMKIARRLGKPCIHIDFDICPVDRAVAYVHEWIESHLILVLNVAGPRASSDPYIYDCARRLVAGLIEITKKRG